MRKLAALLTTVVVSLALLQAQSPGASVAARKVTTRVSPSYPDLARKMHIQGAVKIEAVVRPNGMVKSTRILGGNPVLIESASDAVKKWKFEPASGETTEIVQLSFENQ